MNTARVLLGALGLTAVLCPACAPIHVIVQPAMPEPETFTKPVLSEFMRTEKVPKIVLRVPAPQGQITQEEARQKNSDLDRAYNRIEKEFLKAGWTVRDRGLLGEVLKAHPNLDYGEIRKKIDTHLILEVVALDPYAFDTRTYKRVDDGQVGEAKHKGFGIKGWRLEAKVVFVETGEIGGIYTLYVARKDCHFVFWDEAKDPQIHTATPEGVVDKRYNSYGVPVDAAADKFVEKLLKAMQGR
jgi:hypothetical protein